MKIYNIWEKIKNEHQDVQDMVLASLDGQLEVRFRHIVDEEITKLGVVYDNDLIADYHALKLLCDESLHDTGLDKHSDLMMYRELIFAVNTIRVNTEDDYGNPDDDIDIEAVFRGDFPSNAVKDLLWNILDKVYHSEFIDIADSTLSNLKN